MDSKAKATDNVVTQQQDGQEENPSNNNNSGSNNNNNGLSSEPAETRSNSQENQSRTRTPFTNLSQIDADLALARTLQEQERAYMMLMMNQEGSDYGSWEAGSYFHDDEDDFGDPHDASDADDHDEDEFDGTEVDYDDEPDAFDVHAHDDASDENGPVIEYDEGAFSSDEAYARALQDAEEREMAARLFSLAGINERHVEEPEEEHGANSQDAWEEVDPDELSYEELLALGEVVGTESRGLSTDTIASLPTVTYKAGSSQNDNNDSCVICRLDYEDDETLTVLSCKHSYHSECISNWLKINKVCPVCSTEVSTSGHS